MDGCLTECQKLLELHSDKVKKLSEELLKKESLDLGALLKILGPRPFTTKNLGDEYIEEYFKKLEKSNEKGDGQMGPSNFESSGI